MYTCASVCCTIHIRVRMYKEIGIQKNMYLCVKYNIYPVPPTHFIKTKTPFSSNVRFGVGALPLHPPARRL